LIFLTPGDTDVTGDVRNIAVGRYATANQEHQQETMKIRLLLTLVGLAIIFALPTFAQQKDTVD